MKVSIIGGGGLVGSCTGFALQANGIVRDVVMIDANADAAAGHALDLLHGAASMGNQYFHAGGYEHVKDSDLICITAGLRRKPDESRLDLINRNVDLFLGILAEVEKAGLKPSAKILVVSNPVDVLTYLAAKRLNLPARQVLGLGTQLDTLRFRGLIAEKLNAAPMQVNALILGEHGDSMVPIWSSANIGGLPLDKFPGWNAQIAGELFTRTKTSGAEMLKKKGGAGFAVGVAIRDVIEAIALDAKTVLPVSSVQAGCYGIRDVATSVPTVVGADGVAAHFEIELWPKELQAMKHSAAVLRETIDTVEKRLNQK
ncbi:MAG: lactate/malate dehydrogenase family protein [Pirellulales bacterium]